MNAMNTGICKKTLLGLTALIALSACSELPSLGTVKEAIVKPAVKGAKPLSQAQMVQGEVTLVPPSGYCIDPSSLTQQFALMARCDALGGTDGALDAPLGLLTVSIAKSKREPLAAANIARANGTQVIETIDLENVAVVSLKTETPPVGLSEKHLRGAAKINGYDLSLALFSPSQSEAQGSRGPQMLQSLVQASRDASVASTIAAKYPVTDQTKKPRLGGLFPNLFD